MCEGSTIHREAIYDRYNAADKVLWYYYDQGGVCAVEYNGTVYHLKRNLQGDVVMIVGNDGNIVAKYVYDAWGNQRVYKVSGSTETLMNGTEDHICNYNPWRYRGYYFDRETGLYYLQSRYYDPATGRFLNADSVDYADPQNLQGLNLYAYCANNPVMYVDPTGHFFLTILIVGAIVGTAIGYSAAGAAKAYDTAKEFGSSGWELFGYTLSGLYVGDYLVVKNNWDKLGLDSINFIDEDGVLQFNFDDHKYYNLYTSRLYAKYLQKRYNVSGRTRRGLDIELKAHYIAYKLGVMVAATYKASLGTLEDLSKEWPGLLCEIAGWLSIIFFGWLL